MRRRIIASLSVILALALLAFLASRLDWPATRAVLTRSGPAGLAAFAAWSFLTLLLQATGWHCLLRSRGWPIPFHATLTSFLMGNSLAYLAPSMYLGGEPLRIWHISRRFGLPSREVAATVISNKFAEFAGFMVAVLVCTATMVWRFDLSSSLKWGATTVAAGLLVAFVVVLAAFVGRWPLASGMLRILGKRGERVRRWAEDTEGQVQETFRHHGGAFGAAILLTGGPLAMVVLKPLIFFHFTGHQTSFPDLALIFVMTQIVLAFHVTPGGLGVFEGGVIWTFSLIGISAPEAAAYAATQRLTDAVIVGLGVALAAREGATGFFRGRQPAEEKPA
ncbi:MAG: lysylphosphatidylglycerol synthase transmembrane domain-containing protein [Planctomycetota bacterium]